jgi:hypothetical protein
VENYHVRSSCATNTPHAEQWRGCDVTITTAETGLLRKRWRTDGGKPEPDGTFPTWYRSEVYHVADLEALRDMLCHLSAAPEIALVMGTPKHSDGKRHRKTKENYTDNGSTLLCLDFDRDGLPADPEKLRDTLLEPLRGAAAVVQRTSSDGWNGHSRYRFFFPLSASMTLPRMEAIAVQCGADKSIYQASSLLYTADPVDDDGAPVPIDYERFSLLSGAPVVDVQALSAFCQSVSLLAISINYPENKIARKAAPDLPVNPVSFVTPLRTVDYYRRFKNLIENWIAPGLAAPMIGKMTDRRKRLFYAYCVCLSYTETEPARREALAVAFCNRWFDSPERFYALNRSAMHGSKGKRERLSPRLTAQRLQLPDHLAALLKTAVWVHHKGTGKETREAITERTEARRTEARRMRSEGYSFGMIGKEMNESPDSIKKLLKSDSVEPGKFPLCMQAVPPSLSQASALNVLSSSDSERDSEKSAGTSTMTPTPGALLSAFLILKNIMIPHPDVLPWGTAPRSTGCSPLLLSSPSEARKLLHVQIVSAPLDDGFCYSVSGVAPPRMLANG